ncbi:hypothetical protein PAUR_a3431 [Pseudoalteromonas aurantia 208]|uniref:Uncharacterized protein n=1 Tax=Pseudoalteromonas aurantia 208 TaxID=1314867 RepID=A0ABR9E653_9GAMM|nr:hypothetical protein [Pseudoalteromonas aurantia 208]
MELILYRDDREVDRGIHIRKYFPRGSYRLTLINNGGGTRGGMRYEYREN